MAKTLGRVEAFGTFALFLLSSIPATAAEDPALSHARFVLSQHPVIDGHNDLPWAIRESAAAPSDVVAYDLRTHTKGNTDLPRLRAGCVGGQFWSVYVPAESARGLARMQLEQIDLARRMIGRYPDQLALATSAEEVQGAMRSGKIASLLGIEGGGVIQNSLGALRAFFDLGVRYMTLTHSRTTDWADSASDAPRHGGLTPFGREVVREMNRLGMLVDLSHVSEATMEDALRASEAPAIFSHSSARALCDHPRNVPDAVLAKLKANGGLVMVTFVDAFVSAAYARAAAPLRKEYQERARGLTDAAQRHALWLRISARMPKIEVTIGQVADHLDHIRAVAGPEHVGLGGDYDGNDEWPRGLEDVSGYPRLFAELVRRGWSDEDLARLADGNSLRAMQEAERVAARLQASRPASIATIEVLDGARR